MGLPKVLETTREGQSNRRRRTYALIYARNRTRYSFLLGSNRRLLGVPDGFSRMLYTGIDVRECFSSSCLCDQDGVELNPVAPEAVSLSRDRFAR